MTSPPRPAEYIAIMVNVLLGAVIIWTLGILARRFLTGRTARFAEMAIVVALCIPLNALRSILSNHFPYLRSPLLELLGVRGVMILGACVAIVGLIVVVVFHRGASRIAVAALTMLSPFCMVTFGQAIWRASQYDAAEFGNKPPAPLISGATGLPRVLWIIADEWDYRLSFVDREATLQLPELDRLRQTAIFLDHAYAPGSETPVSIPAYYTGRNVNYVRYAGPRELEVVFKDTPTERWSTMPNVFERARGEGANAALLEWFHPTCRVLNGLGYCEWWPMAMQYNSMGGGFFEILPNQTRSLFETNILSLFGRSLTARQHTGVYHAMLAAAERLSVDRNFALTVVHLPIPHAPFIYNRQTKQFDRGNAPVRGYLDGLALLDRAVGEIRGTMEKAGVWGTATVILTSDHPFREAAQFDGRPSDRVPYIVKFSGQTKPIEYGKKINTIFTGDLVLSTLRGEVGDAEAVVRWLDARH